MTTFQKNAEIPVGIRATGGVAGRDVSPLSRLTSRELQVLALRCDFYSGEEICARLGIGRTRVHQLTQNAMRKFSARTRGELLRIARLHGVGA